MKNKIKVVLVVFLSFSLFACNSLSEEGEKTFEKMKKAMRKNDSFKLTIRSIYTLENEPFASSGENYYKINDFYSKHKEGYIYIEESKKNIENIYLKNNQECVENLNGTIQKNEEGSSFKFELEFLKLEQRFLKQINIKEKESGITMSIKLDLKSLENRSIYFNGSKDVEFSEEVSGNNVTLILNKDYTIKKCKTTYFISTDEGMIERKSTIDFLEYGHQDIPFPEGM